MENLIKEIKNCKVEWRKLGEVANYEQPTRYLVKTKNYSNEFDIPVLTAGKTFILGYTSEKNGIYKASQNPVIIFDDFTTANKWVNFDFKVKSSAMKMITSKDESKVLLKYIYYWLNNLPNVVSENDHKRQWINNYSKKLIPIPPLDIQEKIVKILDRFTDLTTELTTELTLRKKQYSYYLNKLLTFRDDEVEWRKLGEVIKLEKGKQLNKTLLKEKGKYPAYNGGITYSGFTDKYNYDENKIIISQGGASAGYVNFVTTRFYANAHCYVVLPNENIIDNKYLYHFLKLKQGIIMKKQHGAGIPALKQSEILNIIIPIPPLEKQKEIVKILDKFHTLTNSLTEGLPREINLRQKQYEYYRNLLFNFK